MRSNPKVAEPSLADRVRGGGGAGEAHTMSRGKLSGQSRQPRQPAEPAEPASPAPPPAPAQLQRQRTGAEMAVVAAGQREVDLNTIIMDDNVVLHRFNGPGARRFILKEDFVTVQVAAAQQHFACTRWEGPWDRVDRGRRL